MNRSAPMSEAERHVRGLSRFVDDLDLPASALHAAVAVSSIAHGLLLDIDVAQALNHEGVVAVLRAEDVPGINQVGIGVDDEPLLAMDRVVYVGQPLALVLAASPECAHRAAALVRAEIEELPPRFDLREALAKGELLAGPRLLERGDPDQAFAACAQVLRGSTFTGGQEHLYLEPQGAVALLLEVGCLRVLSSTQSPGGVQRAVARVLGIDMNQVEVDVCRLGGGFGGKESQASPWAALAALGAWHTGRPVKLVLERREDMVMTGKRHPCLADFCIGLDADGRILAYELELLLDGGAATDLSPAILERALLHATGCYQVPNVRVRAAACRTNLPPNTAMRGFGAPQAVFVMEYALHQAARAIGLPAALVQERNLLKGGDTLPYGQPVTGDQARHCWRRLEEDFDLAAWRSRVEAFNRAHPLLKKGLALMPVCFGIAFTHRPLNQASALVHVYGDGSVGVSTGAVEMGQGVNARLRRLAAETLGIEPVRVKMESTNTGRVANASPTAASFSADLNGRALESACAALRERLLTLAAELLKAAGPQELSIDQGLVRRRDGPGSLDWSALVAAAYNRRIGLSAQAHYAVPGLAYDAEHGTGQPFAYQVFGVAAVEATIDVLRGVFFIDRVAVVHDRGKGGDEELDRGQIEGGLVQGIGWMTMEELRRDQDGRLQSNSLASYKIPDVNAAPAEIEIRFLPALESGDGLLGSKAVGEPPFLYGIGAYFAIQEALRAWSPGCVIEASAPLTVEKLLLGLHDKHRSHGTRR